MSDLNVQELIDGLNASGLDVHTLTEEGMGLSPSTFVEETDEAPSPFIPETNIQFAVDSTSLDSAFRCARLYQYVIIEGYRPKHENIHLRFGIEFHTCMADYEACRIAGENHNDAVFDTIRALLFRLEDFWPDPDTKAGKYKSRLHLIMAVIKYLDEHQDDPAETLMLKNGKPAVELSFRVELGMDAAPGQPYILCGHIDKLVKFQGYVFGKDYKTTTYTPTDHYWKQYDYPDNQMTIYTIATRIILPEPAKGMMIESIQNFVEDPPRITRGLTYRTEDQLDEWILTLECKLIEMRKWSEDNYWPMNPTACDKYGGCPFRPVCNVPPSMRDAVLETEYEKGERWNPLKPR